MAYKNFTTDTFVERAILVHGDAYDYSKVVYINCHTKVEIVCPKHGSFFQSRNKHISSRTKCPACAKRPIITTEVFIERAKRVHGDRYDYSKSQYKSFAYKVEIICKKHGSFFQNPEHHFRHKQGCPECKFEKAREGIGYYNEHLFRVQPKLKNIPATLYVVEFSNEQEKFIKIGITIEKDLKRRFYGIPYTGKILQTKKLPLFEAFKLEQHLKKANSELKYKPIEYFHGWTECFSVLASLI